MVFEYKLKSVGCFASLATAIYYIFCKNQNSKINVFKGRVSKETKNKSNIFFSHSIEFGSNLIGMRFASFMFNNAYPVKTSNLATSSGCDFTVFHFETCSE